MPEIISDTSLAPVRLNNSELVVQDDSGHYNPIDLEEYNNRELVNLENAAVNIENSSDVIIGPVTQFNVNGNVTIFQNGQEAVEGESVKKEETSNENQVNRRRSIKYLKQLILQASLKIKLIVLLTLLLTLSSIGIVLVLNPNIPEDIVEGYFGDFIGSHSIYYRRDWKGKPPTYHWFSHPPAKRIIISHSNTITCDSVITCAPIIRSIQESHMADGWSDIGYNFLIGGDGNVYVGGGWNLENFHLFDSVGICFVGNFKFDFLNDTMIEVARLLSQKAVDLGKIIPEYILVGQNQTSRRYPDSPGSNVVKVIKTWSHYSNRTLFK